MQREKESVPMQNKKDGWTRLLSATLTDSCGMDAWMKMCSGSSWS